MKSCDHIAGFVYPLTIKYLRLGCYHHLVISVIPGRNGVTFL